jgi:ferredoxin--NADP+ reductase
MPDLALPDVHMHLHTPADPGLGVVVSNERCTSGKSNSFIRHVVIDVTKTRLAGNFRAGQSFGVIPPGADHTGRPHKLRLYSIASPASGEDGQGGHVATTVKRTIDEHWESHKLFLGVASNYLADLQVGDPVTVTGPNGKRFLLPEKPAEHDYLFIATGTGIAPFRGMLRELDAAGFPSRAALLMGSPYATDLVYHEEMLGLAARRLDFTYLTALSRQPQLDGGGPMYVDGRLEAGREQLGPLLASERTLIYICGIAGMELGVLQRLAGVLAPGALDQYVRVDPSVAADPRAWTRRMIHRELKITRRVMLEVY